MKAVTDYLSWTSMTVVGHSMGTGISVLFTGCYPELVNRLVLLEGLGPITKPDVTAPDSLRKAVDAELQAYKTQSAAASPKVYLTYLDAVKARVKSVTRYPGTQSLSMDAACLLVSR